MKHRLSLATPLVVMAFFLALPLLLFDLALIYLMERPQFELVPLLLLLLVFYVVSVLASVIVDGLIDGMVGDSAGHHWLYASANFCVSGLTLYVMNDGFSTIDLSVLTIIAVACLHTIIAYLIHVASPTEETEQQESFDVIDQQIVQLLRTENAVTSVDIIHKMYPELTKVAVMKRVRRLSRSV